MNDKERQAIISALGLEFTEVHGPRDTWDERTKERYHAELGIMVNCVGILRDAGCLAEEGKRHHPDCDVNDPNIEGIRKPCNCGATAGSRLPHRRVTMELKLGADSREVLIGALDQIVMELAMGRLSTQSTCGSPSYGYMMSITEDESVTHESYFAAVNTYLDAERAAQANAKV